MTPRKPMAADYPLFGTGPGTFGTVFQLYLISSATYWPEQLHNDWLETRITFGWLGIGAVAGGAGVHGFALVRAGRHSRRPAVCRFNLAVAGGMLD